MTDRSEASVSFRPVARVEALGSLFWLAMLFAWWQGVNGTLWHWLGWDPPPFAAAPVWDRITPFVMVFIVGGFVRDAVALVRPHAVRFHAIAGLLLNVIALRALFTLLGAGEWVILNPIDPTLVFAQLINGGVWILVLIVTVVIVASAAHDTRRLGAFAARSVRP